MSKSLKVTILAVAAACLFLPGKGYGQTNTAPPPDCLYFITATTTAGSPSTISFPNAAGFNNTSVGCQTWTVFYTATATSGTLTNVDFQSALGAVTAGTFGDWGGTIDTGINPNTSNTTGTSTFSTGCASTVECNVVNSWTKVLFTRNNFIGNIRGVVMGYKSGYPGGGGGGGGGGGCTSPCPVTQDTVPWVDQITGTSTALADGVSNTQPLQNAGTDPSGVRNFPTVFNGTTSDRQFYCPLSAPITISAGTDAVIVTGVASTRIRVCHLDFASDTVTNVTVRQGTGSTCGTNTLSLTGAYPNIVTIAEDYQPTAPLQTTIAARDLCVHLGTSATIGGVVIYAQY